MEQIKTTSVDDVVKKPHKLVLENREKLTLTGVGKVQNANEHAINVEINGTNLLIEGSEMQVAKLDVQAGMMEVLGVINQLKYSTGGIKNAKNLLSRVFR